VDDRSLFVTFATSSAIMFSAFLLAAYFARTHAGGRAAVAKPFEGVRG